MSTWEQARDIAASIERTWLRCGKSDPQKHVRVTVIGDAVTVEPLSKEFCEFLHDQHVPGLSVALVVGRTWNAWEDYRDALEQERISEYVLDEAYERLVAAGGGS